MKAFITLLLSLLPWLAAGATISDGTISVDGRMRRFLLHDFAGKTPAPLVILLHGGGGSGENMAEQSGFDAVAEREGVIAVYPYGTNSVFSNILLTWNAGHCCAYSIRENVDDVRFLSLLIDQLIATGRVDPARVYVTGLSNGGMMTHRIGIELADKVAAIAPVIASLYGDEPVREYAMPTLIINGADDQRVKADGGELQGFGLGNAPADLPTLPISSQRDYWASINGCTAFTDTTTSEYDLRSYSNCRAGGAVQSYVVKGNGHAWPGGTSARGDADQPVQTVNANELIWAFFKQHRRTVSAVGGGTAWYYDGQLTVPVFSANGLYYSARLGLLPRTPMEFELLDLQQLPATTPTNGNIYHSGVLKLEGVMVGSARLAAILVLSNAAPVRLRLQQLQ